MISHFFKSSQDLQLPLISLYLFHFFTFINMITNSIVLTFAFLQNEMKENLYKNQKRKKYVFMYIHTYGCIYLQIKEAKM